MCAQGNVPNEKAQLWDLDTSQNKAQEYNILSTGAVTAWLRRSSCWDDAALNTPPSSFLWNCKFILLLLTWVARLSFCFPSFWPGLNACCFGSSSGPDWLVCRFAFCFPLFLAWTKRLSFCFPLPGMVVTFIVLEISFPSYWTRFNVCRVGIHLVSLWWLSKNLKLKTSWYVLRWQAKCMCVQDTAALR